MLTEIKSIILTDLKGGKQDESESTRGQKRTVEEEEMTETLTSQEPVWIDDRGTRRAKKFRKEWMNEVYFKDWLRPHPKDDTYCICIACDIRLRCGKSELEKHASGMKHSRRMDAMIENNSKNTLTDSVQDDGTFFVSSAGDEDAPGNSALQSVSSSATVTAEAVASESTLAKALLKFSTYLDSNTEMAKKKMTILETEHLRRMQVLNKELELRSLEVMIRQNELQKLNNCVQPSVASPTPLIHNGDDDGDEKY